MKYFVTGGTGVIGRRVVPLLVELGHDVTVLSRSAGSDDWIQSVDARPVRADLFDRGEVVTATSGHDAVINLATSIPPLKRAARPSAWTMNDRIRTEGVDNLVAAVRANGITRYVQESVTFNYVDAGDRWIDEQHPRTTEGIGRPVGHAEAATIALSADGATGVVLRFGQFYDVDSDHTASHAAMLRRRMNPFIGDADGYFAVIGVPAGARAVVDALTAAPGVYNVVDDDTPTRREAARAASDRLGVRPPRGLPASVLRRMSAASEIVMRSQRVSNEKIRAATGWRPDHAGADGLADTIAEIAS